MRNVENRSRSVLNGDVFLAFVYPCLFNHPFMPLTLPSCLSNHIKIHYIDHYTPLNTVYHPLHQSHPFNHSIYPNLPPNKKKPSHQDRVWVSRRIGKKNWTFEVIDDTSNLSTTAALRVTKSLRKKSSTRNILEMFGFGESFFLLTFFLVVVASELMSQTSPKRTQKESPKQKLLVIRVLLVSSKGPCG